MLSIQGQIGTDHIRYGQAAAKQPMSIECGSLPGLARKKLTARMLRFNRFARFPSFHCIDG
jgi:hypothetical protein